MIEEVIGELLKFSEELLEIHNPVDKQLIKDFESKYSLILPGEYKQLIERTNGFSLLGNRVLGLSNRTDFESLGSVYQFEHFEINNPQPLYLIPFSNDGRGNFYCFDTRNSSKDKQAYSIVFWQSDFDYSNDEPEVTNETLSEWIKEVVIDWTLEDYDYEGNER